MSRGPPVVAAWNPSAFASKNTGDTLPLSHLTHAVLAPGVEEKIYIEFSDVRLDHGIPAEHLRCKAYVGPQAALVEGDGPDKSRLREIRLEFVGGSNPKAIAEIPIGAPNVSAAEPWAIRIKLYRRPASNLFAQEIWYEVVSRVPLMRTKVTLTSDLKGRYGTAMLEVLRLVPRTAVSALQAAAGEMLRRAVEAGVEGKDMEQLIFGIRELGPDTISSREASHALETAARMGLRPVVELLLSAGAHATLLAARNAERAENGAEMARDLFVAAESNKTQLSARAIEERMPLVADRLLADGLGKLETLSPEPDGLWARKAHCAGAWSVLTALLERGDQMPCKPRLLLDYALRAGHAGLARACLRHMGEDTKDMDAALRTCLDHGRTEIVREALEVMWKARSSQWSEGPPLLSLEVGPSDQPAECSVCFDSLYTNPGVYVNDEGLRVCGHFTCLTCAEHVQDEATERFRAWRQRREPRIPKPPGPVCPLCRATFAAAVRLSDPSVDPKSFFRLACVPESGDEVPLLKEKYAIGAIEAILPVNASTFAPIFDQLWPQWCEAPDEGMKESDFMRPDGMLAWLSSHILERKIDDQLGVPPSLQEAESWFRHFDFHGNGHLSKSELLRGIVKSYDVAQLVPQTPSRKARTVGVYKLRELVEALWDEDRWDAAGVSFDDFVGRSGLAQRLLDAFPPEPRRCGDSKKKSEERLSVEEALAKARASDFQTIEEDEARAKERAEKQKRQLAPAQPPEMPVPRQRNGAQVLLASLLEAAQEESRVGATQQIHIQCPFCNAVNAARASQRHRIICGACRSVFAVPQLTGQR